MTTSRALRARACALLTALCAYACGGSDDSMDLQDASAAQEPSCDVLALFATDGLADVGCTGAICHSAGLMSLDLQSDGIEQRLLDQSAKADGPCAGEILVDSDNPQNSLLLKKINGESTCGAPMPLTMPSALTEDQVRCIEEYVLLVASRQ